MSTRRLAVLVAFADAARGAALAEALGDDNFVIVVHPSELEEPGAADVIVSDGAMLDPEGLPQVVVGGRAGAPAAAATLPADAGPPLIAAAARLAAAGYRLVPAERGGSPGSDGQAGLTQREREALELLAEGASNKLIARKLDISVHTAKFHVAAVLAKLHARNRADAVAIGLRQGLLYL